MAKIVTLVITIMLATTAGTAFAQVDYDSIRRAQDLFESLISRDDMPRARRWSIRDEADTFTRETHRFVLGIGKQGLLFIVANCESAAVLLRNSAGVFANGRVESIWDDGGIVEHQFDDRDSVLFTGEIDWLRRLVAHNALRVRVTAYPESYASDDFNLTEGGSVRQEKHVRELFREIGCAF